MAYYHLYCLEGFKSLDEKGILNKIWENIKKKNRQRLGIEKVLNHLEVLYDI